MTIKVSTASITPELAAMIEKIAAGIRPGDVTPPRRDEIEDMIVRVGALAGASVLHHADENIGAMLQGIVRACVISCSHVLAALDDARVDRAVQLLNAAAAAEFSRMALFVRDKRDDMIALSAKVAVDYSEAQATHAAAATIAATVERHTDPRAAKGTH